MKAKRSVKGMLISACVLLVMVVSVILGGIAIWGIKSSTSMAIEEYKIAMNDGYNSEIKSEVQSVIHVLNTEYDRVQSGEITEEEAKENAKEIVRGMRYREDESGYFWIDDTDYVLVMHPILADQEGNNRYELEDQNGVMIIQEIMKVCQSAEKGGFNEFYFTKSDGVTVAPKVAYSQIFEPWGWVVSTGNYVDDMSLEMSQVENRIQSQFVKMCILVVVSVVIMLVVALVVSAQFGKSICKPLVKIQELATRLAHGDLTTAVDVKAQNELGVTADALNTAQAQMVGLISRIQDTSVKLADALKEFETNFGTMSESIQNVSIAMNEIANNSTEQAEATTSATEGISIIADQIDNTSGEVETLDKNTETMEVQSQKSVEALSKLIDVNNKTKDDIDLMYSQTMKNNEAVAKISESAVLITEIASQTNLLSLNASIEAARAGESGRGFAVVAEEIGHLANQSAETAEVINKIIGELTDNSQKSTDMMKRMKEVSEDQVNVLTNTNSMFGDLQQALKNCVQSLNLITNHITEMDAQKNVITENVDSLGRLATDNAASTEETSSMSTELDHLVGRSGELLSELSGDVDELRANISKFLF
ncbi:MAG: methyl-accepting chemotaxis protein [Lachnospiraceae bacterium]|nr:methyl-accepting chemotaxis protein [Lachnospiraceae bacterium]MDD7147536.1 methyl-accepting chemotaxis protein [Lachnospiraceae bacterium]MDY4070044.1 methyl-accepting chemotaxis protein [Lachnospiraceae bacterium]